MMDMNLLNFDLDGDGIADAYTQEEDLNGDGVADALYVDIDNDGNADFVVFDSDGDGTMDSILAGFDTDGDGAADTFVMLEDTDGNQIVDSLEIFHEDDETGELDLLTHEDFDDDGWGQEADSQDNGEPEELHFRELDGERMDNSTDYGSDEQEYVEMKEESHEGDHEDTYGGRIVGYTDTGVSDLENDLASTQEYWV